MPMPSPNQLCPAFLCKPLLCCLPRYLAPIHTFLFSRKICDCQMCMCSPLICGLKPNSLCIPRGNAVSEANPFVFPLKIRFSNPKMLVCPAELTKPYNYVFRLKLQSHFIMSSHKVYASRMSFVFRSALRVDISCVPSMIYVAGSHLSSELLCSQSLYVFPLSL